MIIRQRGLMPTRCIRCGKSFLKSTGTRQKICYNCRTKKCRENGAKVKLFWVNKKKQSQYLKI